MNKNKKHEFQAKKNTSKQNMHLINAKRGIKGINRKQNVCRTIRKVNSTYDVDLRVSEFTATVLNEKLINKECHIVFLKKTSFLVNLKEINLIYN